MAILHFYSTNSPVLIKIMYFCNQFCIKKIWHYQTVTESITFKIDDDSDSYDFILELINDTFGLYTLENEDDISIEITKNDRSIVSDFITTASKYILITKYLTYLKNIDRHELDNLYKSCLISHTKNTITKTFPQEIIEHILQFI